jgi:hypothetical protein
MGSQNDLLRWQKGHDENNPLNAVEFFKKKNWRDGVKTEDAFAEALDAQNVTMQLLLRSSEADPIRESTGPWTCMRGLSSASAMQWRYR